MVANITILIIEFRWESPRSNTKDLLMGGFQHLHFLSIYESSVTHRRILFNLSWIYALVIGSPRERMVWRPRADVGGGGDRFQIPCIFPTLGKVSLDYSPRIGSSVG